MKPILLCILDGFGIGDEGNKFNAIAQAKMPNYQRFLKTYPHSQLKTSGLDVGLPEGQISNSKLAIARLAQAESFIKIYQKLTKRLSTAHSHKTTIYLT